MEFEDFIEYSDEDVIDQLPDDITDDFVSPEGDDSPDNDVDEEQVDEPSPIDPDELKVYYDHLNQMGVLRTAEDFEFDGTYEKLEEAITKTRESLRDEVKTELQTTLPDDFKALLDYALAGGTSIDAYVEAYSNSNLEDLDLTTLENQRKVLYESYRQTTQYKPEKIQKMIDRYEEMGTIEAEALDALEVLVEEKERRKAELIDNAKAERAAAVEAAENERNAIGAAIDKVSTDKLRAGTMKSFLFNPVRDANVTTTKFNQVIKAISANPEHLAQLADILMDYNPDKGIQTARLEKKIKNEGVKSFKKLVEEKLNSGSPVKGGTHQPTNSKSQFNWDEFINT